jgi:aspartate/methionine/tyrosine aminotransferase
MSVTSLTKSYGIKGIRFGWLIDKNASLQHTSLAAKDSSSVFDGSIAEQALSRKDEFLRLLPRK